MDDSSPCDSGQRKESCSDSAGLGAGGSKFKESLTVSSAKRYAYRNVYGVGTELLLCYSAQIGLIVLQSSLNSLLGLISLVVLFAASNVVGFLSVGLIAAFGTKNNLIIVSCLALLYCLCNYHAAWYTLIPGALLGGIASGMRWASIPAHIKGIAERVAPILEKDQQYLIGKYTGIVFSFHYLSFIPGNLASSLLLYPFNYNASDVLLTYSDAEFSGSANVSLDENPICKEVDPESVGKIFFYSLLSVYIVFIVASILILIFFVDRLETEKESSFFSSDQKLQLYLKKPLCELLGTLKRKMTILAIPVLITSGILSSFAYGTLTKYFISDCFGVHLVGFVIIVLGVTGAVVGMLYGKAIKVVPRFILVLLASVFSSGLVVFLLVWERVPSYAFIFSFAILWGGSESIWNTYAASLPGVLGLDGAPAGSVFSSFSTGGYAVGFLVGAVLTVKAQLWFVLSVIILAALCGLILEFMLHRKMLNVKQGHGTHADCNSGSPQNQAAGFNALFAVYRNRRASTQSMIREDNKSQDLCSSSVAGSAIGEPCFVEKEGEIIFITPM